MRADVLRSLSLFDGLTDAQVGELAQAGAEVRIEPGIALFREGERADSWWVLVDGAIDLTRHVGREDILVGSMDVPGRWAGGFRAWDEHGVYLATGRGVAEGRVLRVPSEALRERMAAWFPFGGHLIAGLYRTARTIESTARQREALVALGTLAAGLAHEINNPAAAATRAVDALQRACETLLSSLGQLTRSGVTTLQLTQLDALRREIEPRAPVLDPLDIADEEEVLSSWLGQHGVDSDWMIAPPLAAAGVDAAWCERVASVLDDGALEQGLVWAASTFSAATLLSEVKESTRRVSDLVAAVKSYTQMDRAAIQNIDVRDGLESTLVMLSDRLRSGVQIQRRYDANVPRIDAYAGELNQVWTNLIENAIDAMEGEGTLSIVTGTDGDHVVVEIGDTGSGMPPSVAERAFEPFYTTKDVGRGTGLGLDIAQRIVVDRHGGSISIDSRPGRTVLRTRIPVRATARPGQLGSR